MTWPEWIAWAGIALPLFILSWTAWRFTQDRSDQREQLRFERFFSVTDKIGQQEGSLLSKVAALYELRKFSDCAEVIERMTKDPDIKGDGRARQVLEQEFRLTHEAMRKD